MKLLKNIKTSVLFYVFIASVFLTSLLFIKPVIGVADNSDFIRVLSVSGLDYKYETRFTNIVSYYKITGRLASFPGFGNYVSTHLLLIKSAIAVNNLFFSRNIFDIRFLGIVFSILFIVSLMLITLGMPPGNKISSYISGGLLVFIFCDVGYLSYFNSFYGEAPTYVFLLLTAGIAVYMARFHKVKLLHILLFYTAAFLFIGSKQANAILGLIIPIIGFSFIYTIRKPGIIIFVTAASILMAVSSVILYQSVSTHMKQINQYHSVFFGILKDSPSPAEDLRALGLDLRLKELTNTTYYDMSIPLKANIQFVDKYFYNKISYSKIIKYYLTHPGRFYHKLEITAKNSVIIRPPYLGNFVFDETGKRMEFTNRAVLWSTFKKVYLPDCFSFVFSFFIIYLAVLVHEFIKMVGNKRDRHSMIYICLVFMLWTAGVISFITPILAAGEADMAKHLFLYNVSFDMLLASGIIFIIYRAPRIKIWLRPIASLLIQQYTSRIKVKLLKLQRKNPIGRKVRMQFVVMLLTVAFFSAATAYMLLNNISATSQLNQATVFPRDKTLKTGSYVKYGSYQENALLWRIVKSNSGLLTLAADKIICFKPFDIPDPAYSNPERKKFGSNFWEQSSLREWLNNEQHHTGEPGFLSSFTTDQLSLLVETKQKCLLSANDISFKEGGNSLYYWTNCVPLLFQNYYTAYYRVVTDKVYLPDVRDVKVYFLDNRLATRKHKSFSITSNARYNPDKYRYLDYWLRTPYANSASMVRYVGSDGYVYHRDASDSSTGVLPLLKVCYSSVKGDGTRKNPFILEK